MTLRGARMYEFLDRLASIALPRIRDFRGLDPGSFDGRGNYSIGIREQIIFPEIDYDKVPSIRGPRHRDHDLGETDEHGRALLGALGLPFAAPEGNRRRSANGQEVARRQAAAEGRSTRCGPTRAATGAVARARSIASSGSAGSACASSRTRAPFPE